MSNRTSPNDHEEEDDAAAWQSSDAELGASNGSIDDLLGAQDLDGAGVGPNGDSGLNEELLLELEDEADDELVLEAIIGAVDGDPSVTVSIEPLAGLDEPAELDDDLADSFAIEIERVNFDVGPANLDDSVRMYLREIGQVKLLDAAREIELASAMERGSYLALRRTQLTNDFGELPSADVLGRALFHAFQLGWPHIEELYALAYGDEEISKDQMFEPLLAACPSFQPAWKEFLAESELHPDQEPLYYVALGDLSRHLVERLRSGATAEFPAVFQVVENWHCLGDHYVREAATVGMLEGLQNIAGHEGVDPTAFEKWLLPESKKWWVKLNRFWT